MRNTTLGTKKERSRVREDRWESCYARSWKDLIVSEAFQEYNIHIL